MDVIIATQLNGTLKQCASAFAHSATEAANPQVRQAFADASRAAIDSQQQLFSLMENRGWYVPPTAHSEDIQQIIPQLEAMKTGSAVTV